jgi:hypothetical protein
MAIQKVVSTIMRVTCNTICNKRGKIRTLTNSALPQTGDGKLTDFNNFLASFAR